MFLGVILHRTYVGIFDPLKNMAAVTKNRTSGQTVVFRIYLQNRLVQPDSDMGGKSVQHDEIYLWSNFHVNMLSHVGVIALFQLFFAILNVISFKNLLL